MHAGEVAKINISNSFIILSPPRKLCQEESALLDTNQTSSIPSSVLLAQNDPE